MKEVEFQPFRHRSSNADGTAELLPHEYHEHSWSHKANLDRQAYFALPKYGLTLYFVSSPLLPTPNLPNPLISLLKNLPMPRRLSLRLAVPTWSPGIGEVSLDGTAEGIIDAAPSDVGAVVR